MSEKIKITPEYIRSLTPEEWANFRMESWNKKRQYYAQPTPEWYLKDRKSYVQFLERLNKRKEFVAQGKHISKPTESLTQKVEILAGDDVDSFADE
ncbi:MAG: hypothetical protein LBF36_00595 [Mycoplasmataceae bacterium]|jgi:hypothetical protein|nr:hypothetical protein [Mycoplasmataceae bacterium]